MKKDAVQWEGPPDRCSVKCFDKSDVRMVEGQLRGWCIVRARWCRVADYETKSAEHEVCDLP